MERLQGATRDYPWGSVSVLQELLGLPVSGVPMAELWLGAYPSAPSRVTGPQDPAGVPLDAFVRRDPEATLGADVVARFGPELPYLLKVLAVDRPLSLQVHPTRSRARDGYAAEDAAGIPVDDPRRTYRDRNPKPEMLYALTEVEALCGFRSAARTAEVLSGLAAPLARELEEIMRGRPASEAIPHAVHRLLDEERQPAPSEVDEVARACAERLADGSPFPAEDRVVALLADAHPGDPGIVVSLLLNHVLLEPGAAMFVPAGSVHCYLHGVGVEIMASSDNVLRAGLTSKHINRPELLAAITPEAAPPARIAAAPASRATQVFSPPVEDFSLSVTTVEGDAPHSVPGHGPRILLCLDGELTVAVSTGGAEALPRGRSVFVPASDGELTVTGQGTLVQGSVP